MHCPHCNARALPSLDADGYWCHKCGHELPDPDASKKCGRTMLPIERCPCQDHAALRPANGRTRAA